MLGVNGLQEARGTYSMSSRSLSTQRVASSPSHPHPSMLPPSPHLLPPGVPGPFLTRASHCRAHRAREDNPFSHKPTAPHHSGAHR